MAATSAWAVGSLVCATRFGLSARSSPVSEEDDHTRERLAAALHVLRCKLDGAFYGFHG